MIIDEGAGGAFFPLTRFFSKRYRWAAIYSALLAIAVALVLLDTFVIPKSFRIIDSTQYQTDTHTAPENERAEPYPAVQTDDAFDDGNISIVIERTRVNDTNVFIADIRLSSVTLLKSAFAFDTFGRNINESTSQIAASNNAILAINGDTYGFRDSGAVLRNGDAYRVNGDGQALMLDFSGNMSFVNESQLTEETLANAWQIWSFGPALIIDGSLAVNPTSEISGRVSVSNPRTAIGQIEPLHYIFIVSEGRTDDNLGLSLFELARIFEQRGCTAAYNLDGGGSSTMVFNGELVNRPTTNGRRVSEREVSDIVYIGY
ncbi:MAG: phosphodiester glycosidase family protein [Oscillospiraceae bacterium]|jgi:exopolysaccharide biosynthesis protein|nr:phosphodiester glycosidase family protein [Oscillospiraceae bacterium]